ncbi:MAG: hypothetical protein AABZ33_06650 [Chloroflexota bacterium]
MGRIRGASLTAAIVTLAMVAGACASKPDLTDPREILDGAVAQLDAAKTVRLQLDVSGAIALDLLGTGSARPMLLEGTTLTADLDISGGKAKVTFAAPALLGLTGELLAPGGRAYLKMSLTGPKYVPLDSGGAPSPDASPGPLSLAGLTNLLNDPSVTATKVDDVDCAGGRCYRIRIEVDPSAIDLGLPDLGALSGLLGLPGAASPGPDSGSGSLDGPIVIFANVAKDTLRPVTLESDVVLGESATLELLLTLSAWGESITVEAPPADQVGEPGDLPFPFGLPSVP